MVFMDDLRSRLANRVQITTDGFRAPTKEFIDGVEYDGHKPNAYIEKLVLGLKGQQKLEGGNVVGK